MGGDAVIVAGIGFNSGATAESLANALSLACLIAGVPTVDALASIVAKTENPLLQGFAADQNLPLIAVAVAGIATPSQSARILKTYGTGSLSEAAALACAGPNARLLAPKTTSSCGHATAAIAQELP